MPQEEAVIVLHAWGQYLRHHPIAVTQQGIDIINLAIVMAQSYAGRVAMELMARRQPQPAEAAASAPGGLAPGAYNTAANPHGTGAQVLNLRPDGTFEPRAADAS